MPDIAQLITLLTHQFPAAVIQEQGDQVVILTIHGTGKSIEDAIADALQLHQNAIEDGKNVRQILNDIIDDLKTPGMSRIRRDSLIELLEIASNAINAGVVAEVIPWIQVPGMNREIENLRYRIDTRLNMVALEMQAREKALNENKQTTEIRHALDPAITVKWEKGIENTPIGRIGLIALNNQRLKEATT